MLPEAAAQLCVEECERAQKRWTPLSSIHEGYALLLAEVDELWDAIRQNDPLSVREDAIKVGAMALRILSDRF